MIGMHDNDRSHPRARQQGDQLIGYPLGNYDRQSRVNSQAAQMIDCRQLFHQLSQPRINDG